MTEQQKEQKNKEKEQKNQRYSSSMVYSIFSSFFSDDNLPLEREQHNAMLLSMLDENKKLKSFFSKSWFVLLLFYASGFFIKIIKEWIVTPVLNSNSSGDEQSDDKELLKYRLLNNIFNT